MNMDMQMRKAIREGYGDGIAELGIQHKNIVVLDADLAKATGAIEFAKTCPDRFFDVGIAEQNLIGISVGFAHTGMVPFASSFATFLCGRAFEIIRNSVCYSSANVKMIGTHAGITATGDGGSHQSVEDIAIMCSLPNMLVLSPCDYNQMKVLLKEAYEYKGPVYIRASRAPSAVITEPDQKVTLGKAQVIREGDDLCIVTTGMQLELVLRASEILSKENGIETSVLNLHTLKPLDMETVSIYAKKCKRILIVEEGNTVNGMGAMIAKGLLGREELRFDCIGINDRFGQSAHTVDEIFQEYGFTVENIQSHCLELCRK